MFISGDIMDFIYPFQPPALLHDVIDQSLIDESNKMCDGLLPEGTRNYAISVDHPIRKLQEQIYKMAYDYIRAFENSCKKSIIDKDHKLTISKMWFSEFRDKDYYQAHEHGDNNILSGVLYLKIPQIIKTKYDSEFPEGKQRDGVLVSNANGCIEFVYNPMIIPSRLISSNTFLVTPEVSHIYIWPSWLFHTIYPYYGPDVRRSLSFNIVTSPA
jgi:hypothetical protein